MACSQIIRGLATSCETSLGGLKTVYIANYDDVQAIKESEGQITGITMVEDKKFYQFSFKRNTASMTSTLNVNDSAANNVSTEVSLSFLKQDTEKRIAVSALAAGEMAVIVEDGNGKYWYLGSDFPVVANGGGAESGTVYSDANRYTITLQDISLDFPHEIAVSAGQTGGEYVNLEEIVEKN